MKTNDKKITGTQVREPLCRITIHKKNITKEEVQAQSKINRYKINDFNLFVDLLHMRIHLNMNGKLKSISADKKGIRGRPRELLIKVARRPSVFMSPYDLGNMQPYVESHFIKDNIIQYVRKLRKNLFGEDGINPRYILTSNSPYKVALRGDINVCLIESDIDGLQKEKA